MLQEKFQITVPGKLDDEFVPHDLVEWRLGLVDGIDLTQRKSTQLGYLRRRGKLKVAGHCDDETLENSAGMGRRRGAGEWQETEAEKQQSGLTPPDTRLPTPEAGVCLRGDCESNNGG